MIRRGLALLVAVLCGVLLLPNAAFAVNGELPNTASRSGTGMHVRPEAGAPHVALITPNTETVRDFCYVQGDQLDQTVYWDLVYSPRSTRAGFTNEDWLTRKDQTLSCFSSEALNSVYKSNWTAHPAGHTALHQCASASCAPIAWLTPYSDVLQVCQVTGAWHGGSNQWSLLVWRDASRHFHSGWTNNNWLANGSAKFIC